MAAKNYATVEELLTFANLVREAGGGNPIDAVMPAVPSDPHQCLVAKNLNFNCIVMGSEEEEGAWVMAVPDRDLAERVSAAIDMPIETGRWWTRDERGYREVLFENAVRLPDRIGNLAGAFDDAHDTLKELSSAIGEIIWEAESQGEKPDLSAENILKVLETEFLVDESRLDVARDLLPYIEESAREAYDNGTEFSSLGIVL